MARRPVYNRHTGVLIPPPGPYAGPHVLYTAHGKLPGGETWTCGLRTTVITPDATELQNLGDTAELAWHTFWAGSGGALRDYNPAGATFDGVTARSLSADGVTLNQYEADNFAPSPGDAGTASGGDQLALTASLHTALAGRHGRGRIYLPFLCGQNDPMTGRIPPAVVSVVVNGMITMIEAMNASTVTGQTNPAIAIQSRVSGLPPAPVTRVTVGDVQDTIRGRRKKLKEVYTPSSLIPSPGPGA